MMVALAGAEVGMALSLHVGVVHNLVELEMIAAEHLATWQLVAAVLSTDMEPQQLLTVAQKQ